MLSYILQSEMNPRLKRRFSTKTVPVRSTRYSFAIPNRLSICCRAEPGSEEVWISCRLTYTVLSGKMLSWLDMFTGTLFKEIVQPVYMLETNCRQMNFHIIHRVHQRRRLWKRVRWCICCQISARLRTSWCWALVTAFKPRTKGSQHKCRTGPSDVSPDWIACDMHKNRTQLPSKLRKLVQFASTHLLTNLTSDLSLHNPRIRLNGVKESVKSLLHYQVEQAVMCIIRKDSSP